MRFKIFYTYIGMLSLAVFSSFSISYGATDTFIIGTVVGGDVSPPTAPTNLIAIPIATDQINLSWTASTDNVAISGYQVFRESSQIATTTLTTYSDSGLISSTTYSYFIRAFDPSLNISSSSVIIATTTLPITATTTPAIASTTTSGGELINLIPVDTEITSLVITPGQMYLDVFITTNVDTNLETRWGRTYDYEMGYSTKIGFSKTHRFRLTDLVPDTIYELEIILGRRVDPQIYRKQVQFRTLPGIDNTAPANVSDFQASITDDGIAFTWNNPDDDDFSHVRILGSTLFYPTNQVDGWFVFEGNDDQALDQRVVDSSNRYYYTIFSYDLNGNVSSGAVVLVSRTSADGSVENIATSTYITPLISFDDVIFVQNNESVRLVDGVVELYADRITTVSIPYELFPEHLKTIVVALKRKKDGATFSFLLSIDNNKTFYTARLGALKDIGQYTVSIDIFDYKTKTIFSTTGEINVIPEEKTPTLGIGTIENIMSFLIRIIPLISFLLLIFLLLLFLLFKRKHEDKRLKNVT